MNLELHNIGLFLHRLNNNQLFEGDPLVLHLVHFLFGTPKTPSVYNGISSPATDGFSRRAHLQEVS
jgi:hypothetical protein